MSQDKPTVSLEKLSVVVRAYCFKENRWLPLAEFFGLVTLMSESWTGSYVTTIQTIFGRTGHNPAKYGPLVRVIYLPVKEGIEQYPEVVKSITEKYGHLIIISGNGTVGVEIYFVERTALALNVALGMFSNTLNLK